MGADASATIATAKDFTIAGVCGAGLTLGVAAVNSADLQYFGATTPESADTGISFVVPMTTQQPLVLQFLVNNNPVTVIATGRQAVSHGPCAFDLSVASTKEPAAAA